MDKETESAGYREIEVTADRGINVWAPDLEELFISAAEGMLSLAGITVEKGGGVSRELELDAIDLETLLVTFLEEIVFILEDEAIALSSVQVSINGTMLKALMKGQKVIRVEYEIKAVTFNNLKILYDGDKYSVTIVFDL